MENTVNNPVKQKARMSTQTLVMLGLLVALAIVLTYMLSFTTGFLRVSFGFIALATAGMLFGPVGGLVVATLADVIGATIFFGAPNPGLTVTASLTGLMYGLFLSRPNISRRGIILCQALIVVLLHLVYNSIVLDFISPNTFWANMPLRAVRSVVLFPVQVFILMKLVDYKPVFGRFLK